MTHKEADNNKTKFCINCKHKDKEYRNFCTHPQTGEILKNNNYLVTGEANNERLCVSCDTARDDESKCGKKGKLFEKLTTKDKQNRIFKARTGISKKAGDRIFYVILFFIALFAFSQLNAALPSSFHKAKKLLYTQVYNNSGQTFYCGCEWSNRKVNLGSCNYEIRKNKKRAARTEAEHIVPAYYLAMLTKEGRKCWSEGTRIKGTNGRKYCLATNPIFKQAHNDLMNLVPAIGEVNGDRSNYKFAMISGEVSNYGSCDMEINRKSKKVEPPASVRGDIARIYFYMRDKYKLQLSNQTTKLMNAWDKQDPMNTDEKRRIDKISRLQK